MSQLIESFEQRYLLGVSEMDDTHREFVELVNQLDNADDQTFIPLFEQLIKHTSSHFAAENEKMQECGFPAIREHTEEHLRVLGDLERFGKRVAAGNIAMGRAYVTQQLPDWFDLHARTMDSALAHHLKPCIVTFT